MSFQGYSQGSSRIYSSFLNDLKNFLVSKFLDMKKIKIIGFVTLILVLVGMTNLIQKKDYLSLIKGTWHYVDEPENKWVFQNSTCFWEFEGEKLYEFTYSIYSSITESGRTHYSLKLVNIVDAKDIYEYSINGLGEKGMHLEYNT